MTSIDISQGVPAAAPVRIADRIWAFGCNIHGCGRRKNAYLIEQGRDSVLINPGSPSCFPDVKRQAESLIPFGHIRWFLCPHQDPDVASALPLIDELMTRRDARIVCHPQTLALLSAYRLQLPFLDAREVAWELPLEDRTLALIATPYAPNPGSLCAFDRRTGVLFSADLFSADYGEDESPRAPFDADAMIAYHRRMMPSGTALDHALAQVERLPIELIAPRKGAHIRRPFVPEAIRRLRHLKCGIHLVADRNSDIEQIWRLRETLHRISDAMLLYRDFADMAIQLQSLMQPLLPAEHLEFHAMLDDGCILTMNPETHFVGITNDEPPDVCGFIGKTREEWIDAHGREPCLQSHQLHGDRFCEQSDVAGSGSLLTLPLTARGQNRIDSIAVIRVAQPVPITDLVERLMAGIAEPLQVALEREVNYRRLDIERERAYQRSIRDPLTGLYTRVYMQDLLSRQCLLHTRDAAATVSVCMLDLDHFKSVNDTYGHLTGDRVLAEVAAMLKANCRATDVPVRYGGEELLVLMIGQCMDGALVFAHRMHELIRSHSVRAGDAEPLRVTVSIGVAEHCQGESIEALIRRADQALYKAKGLGRNRVEMAE